MNLLSDLTKEQIEAVCHREGPLLIIAGAGTGKTTVITRRIAWLITEKLASPAEILALTFTEKAAEEMEERVDILTPYGYTDCVISTFHSFGDRILRDNALELGLLPDFRVLTEAEQIIFLSERLFALPLSRYRPLGNPTRYLKALVNLISRCKDEEITHNEYIEYAERLPEDTEEERDYKERQIEVARCYKAYEDLMKKEGFLDFGDQVILVTKLFKEHPDILKEYQNRFKYILIDEFQDTNFAQFSLIKLLVQDRGNLTVVCDDDQSIFKFRGAAISNILNFQKSYPKHKKLVLTKNFRSTQPILDSAYRLIQHNNPDRLEHYAGIEKRLIGVSEDGKSPTYIHYETVSAEADGVTKIIKEKITEGARPKDFAILVRANSDADEFCRALNVLRIPHHFSGASGLYSVPEVRFLLAFLRFVANPDDTLSLYYISASPVYQMDSLDLARCMSYSSAKNKSLWSVFSEIDNIEVKEETRELTKRILSEMREYIKLSAQKSPGELLYLFLKDTGYISELINNQSPENEKRIENITRFFEQIRRVEPLLKYNRTHEFVSHIDSLIEAGDDPGVADIDPEEDLVHILTVHKAKGLEFPIVFLTGLVQRRFPANNRPELLEIPTELIKDTLPSGDFHIQEERRLFYVGMTRAKRELYLTSAADYGTKRLRKPSQFVFEALDVPKVVIEKPKGLEKLSYFAEKKEPLPTEREGVLTLSHYQIDDYFTCPLKYRYVHILKGLIQKHHAVIYGAALHSAICFYHLRKKERKPVNLDDLIKVLESSWSSEGFLSREHEELRLREAKKALARFFSEQEEKGVIPAYVEQEFKVDISKDIRVIGRFDRVDIVDCVPIIIDFKSSDVIEKEKADKRARDSLQLAIYAYCWNKLYNQIPKVELHFIESGVVGEFFPDRTDLEKTEGRILSAAEGIRDRNFRPNPNYNNCLWCAYRTICDSSVVG